MQHRNNNLYFHYASNDKNGAISDVRVQSSFITLYFKKDKFDLMPNILIDDFLEFNEKFSFHESLHLEDASRDKDHIHFMKANLNETALVETSLTTEELTSFFDTLIKTQNAVAERAAKKSLFEICSFIEEEVVNRLLKHYDDFLTLQEIVIAPVSIVSIENKF